MTESKHDNQRGRSGLTTRFHIFSALFALVGLSILIYYGQDHAPAEGRYRGHNLNR